MSYTARNKDADRCLYHGRSALWRLLLIFVALILLISIMVIATGCNDDSVAVVPDVSGTETPQENDAPSPPTLKTMTGVAMLDESVTYDGKLHMIEPTGVPDGATVEYNADGFKDAGLYLVEAHISLTGYYPLDLSAKLTILPATANISFNDVTFDWDGEPHSIYVQGDLPSDATVTYDGNGKTDVGKYQVTATVKLSDNYVPVSPLTATMTIKERYYTIVFIHGDGTKDFRRVKRGGTLYNIPEPKTIAGYKGRWDRTSFKNVTSNIVVNAVYDEQLFFVSYVLNGGVNDVRNVNMDDGDNRYAYTAESDMLYLYEPTRSGYIFLGWYENDTRIYTVPDGDPRDMTLEARWDPIKYVCQSILLTAPFNAR